MPRFATADIAHTAGTDHRIRRRPDKSLPGLKSFQPGQMPIVNFHQNIIEPGNSNAKRDLGMALTDFSAKNPDVSHLTAQLALALLDEALRAAPEDVPALEARGKALAMLNRLEEAYSSLSKSNLSTLSRRRVLSRKFFNTDRLAFKNELSP